MNYFTLQTANCYLAFSLYTSFPMKCSIEFRAVFGGLIQQCFKHQLIYPQLKLFPLCMWRRKAQTIRNVTQCLVFSKWSHVPDFHSTEHVIAHYLVPSPTEFLNSQACCVWYTPKMKSGICGLPSTPSEFCGTT